MTVCEVLIEKGRRKQIKPNRADFHQCKCISLPTVHTLQCNYSILADPFIFYKPWVSPIGCFPLFRIVGSASKKWALLVKYKDTMTLHLAYNQMVHRR